MLHSKEKILLYGGSNSGKTHAALEFAQQIMRTGHRVFVIDADDGIAKIVTELPCFADMRENPSFQVEPVYDFDDCVEVIAMLKRFKLERGDLVIMEMINNAWEWAQARFAETTLHETVAEHQLGKAEKGRLQYGGFEGRSEWPVIKNLYFSITTPTLASPAHLIWTASSKPLVVDNDKPETKDVFAAAGYKNDGYKDVHYKMDTVLFLESDRKTKQRTFTVVKDRGSRALMQDVPYATLFGTYYEVNDLPMPWTTSS